MGLKETASEIVGEFAQFTDWMDKYEYLIELGKMLEPIPESAKTDRFIIKGCQSRVWLLPCMENGLLYFKADSDAIITKGIISLLIRVFSGRTPSEIRDADLDFITQIGLQDHLSPTRANGLAAMVRQIKGYALAAIK